MTQAKQGDWVRIKAQVLSPEQRAPQIPEDTRKVPLLMWVKGHIRSDASVGEQVEVSTLTGRRVTGELVEVNPYYSLGFGEHRSELHRIGKQVRELLETPGDESD